MSDEIPLADETPKNITPDETPEDITPDEIPGATPDWVQWEKDNPDETWITYQDTDGISHRVPVWHYRKLGL